MASEDTKKVGQRLRELRGALSQRDFAAKVGLKFWTYLRYEHGERMPSPAALNKISMACSVTTDSIIDPETVYTFVEGKRVIKGVESMEERAKRGALRAWMIQVYEGRCGVCGFGVPDILELATIAPPEQKRKDDDLNNFILLCPNCHRMLDRDIISRSVVEAVRDTVLKREKSKVKK